MTRPLLFTNFPKALRTPFGPYMGYVDRVIDGDTVSIMADTGLGHYAFFTGRLKDVHAPESHESGGDECTEELEKLCGAGTRVRITTEKGIRSGKEITTFSRYVVELEALGTDGIEDVNALQRKNIERIRG